jgi:hypothetical protein
MVKMVPPAYANLGMDVIVSYSPPEDEISLWHTVSVQRESLLSIAPQYQVPVARLIEFNFPGCVTNGRINPDIVNWYLFHHERFRCHDTTQDGLNYMFRSGQKVAIPYLGKVEIGQPEIIRSRSTSFRIRMRDGINFGRWPVSGDAILFQICDEKAGLCSYYSYGGIGGGWSPLPFPVSVTTEGPWNAFSVTRPMAVNQFTGFASFSTAGGANKSINFLQFMGLREGIQTIPSPLPLITGTTYGAGGSSTFGSMSLEKIGTIDGLVPFKGS